MYIIRPKIAIPRGAAIVLPISLGQPLHTGEALQALLEYYHSYEPTLLLADSLHRFNSDYESAMAAGDKFIHAHQHLLRGFKLLRWDEWLQQRSLQIQQHKALLQAEYSLGLKFYEKCQKTAQISRSTAGIEKSVEYLIEEYASTLAMGGVFDYLVYPRPAAPGASALYRLFASIPKPAYVNANCCKSSIIQEKSRKLKPSPLAVRLISDQVETLFASSEIALETKLELYEKIVDLASVYL